MTTNKRVYYAIQEICVAKTGATVFSSTNVVHGVQSAGMDTTFNAQDILELGQIDVYTTMEDRPDVNVTINRVLDGTPLLYHMATNDPSVISPELGARCNPPCMIAYAVYPDTQTVASGDPLAYCRISGAYVNSLNYAFPVDGNFTEEIQFVAHDKKWFTTTTNVFTYSFTGSDAPANYNSAVSRRWNIDMTTSCFPTSIEGINGSFKNILGADGSYAAHIQNITIGTSLGRTPLNELGTKAPYYEFANYPVDVTCAVETTTGKGDFVQADATAINLTNQTIAVYIKDDNATPGHKIKFDLGAKNKMRTVNQSGGDTGGGNVKVTYNFANKNKLTIRSTDDPCTSIAAWDGN